MKSELYCDGGVIGKNPSPHGGTWAFCLVDNGEVTFCDSGLVLPGGMGTDTVSNNQTELMAVLMGLEILPDDWKGTVYSDSQVTLGRVFRFWSLNNIPTWMKDMWNKQYHRLNRFKDIDNVLLAGHPTRKQLEEGIGRHGFPVSKHNVWCDHACSLIAQKYLEAING